MPSAICSACGRSAVKLMRCKDCVDDKVASPASYCSKECQRRAWKEHKLWHATQRLDVQHLQAHLATLGGVEEATLAKAEAEAATEPARLLCRGRKLFFQKDLKGAAKCFQKVIQLQPDSALRASAHSLLGAVWSVSNEHLQATQSFLAAMELYPVGSFDWGESATHAWEARIQLATTCTVANDIYCSCKRCSELNRNIPLPDWMRTPAAAKPVVEQMIRACPKHSGARSMAVLVHLQNKDLWGAVQAALLAAWHLAPLHVRAMMVLLVSALGIMMFG